MGKEVGGDGQCRIFCRHKPKEGSKWREDGRPRKGLERDTRWRLGRNEGQEDTRYRD